MINKNDWLSLPGHEVHGQVVLVELDEVDSALSDFLHDIGRQ